jgi:undecaprenyl diphosphate synthase
LGDGIGLQVKVGCPNKFVTLQSVSYKTVQAVKHSGALPASSKRLIRCSRCRMIDENIWGKRGYFMLSTPTKSQETGEIDYPPPANPPYHVGIIMDGSGRWATAQGKSRHEGHRAGTENLRRVLEYSVEFGVKMLTIYAFSTENWRRPLQEVQGLLRILEYMLDREVVNLHRNGVQLRHLGRLDVLQPRLQHKVRDAIELTRHNNRLILNVAFNYGGRSEIVEAAKQMIRDGLPADEITEARLQTYLYTGTAPDPDLIIRTSGEFRTSNFLIWQAAYAEYYVTPTYWPDFDKAAYRQALESYQQRARRYGQAS